MKHTFLILLYFSVFSLNAQTLPVPADLPQSHPRVLTNPAGKVATKSLIADEPWAKAVFESLQKRTDVYVEKVSVDSFWLLSRLQMYWHSHATDVFIRGEVFDHAGGEKAPAPTVRFTGTRGTVTSYARPKLEDILPFMDDDRGLYFINTSKESRPLEWAEPAKTGRNIESINVEIMEIAMNAAFLYWLTDDVKYGKMAADVFDTYMTGIFYRNVPIDLNHGHQQTLVGMSSFEVIHEDIIDRLVPLYDFLYDYLKTKKAEKMPVYTSAFKKFADNMIDKGVPHNNWDIIQANYVMNIALILEDNANYPDGKGRAYYMDYILNRSSIRQWSLTKLAAYGFDSKTGIWAECPGYSQNVVGDYASYIRWADNNLKADILPLLPVVEKAVLAVPQYLFPNQQTVGFGDTHPEPVRTQAIVKMIQNAQQWGRKEQERRFTAMLKCFNPKVAETSETSIGKASINSFFAEKPMVLDSTVAAGKIDDYVSATFWAPNNSWFVQRNGMNPRNSLMISQNASLGNHQHANGVSMELYGKGYTLGPDAGIGTSYFSLDYAEYYSQFLAHNTVCVDGVSSYPAMKSNHGFELKSCFPVPESKHYASVTYSEVAFREPETRADQTRTMSIVTTGPTTGYYVDVFRSRKELGGDKMHDYFYHNLGQKMTLTASDGSPLDLQPTEELAFAGANLTAYSYLYEKKAATTAKDVRATFIMDMPDGDDISMTMWMKGCPGRTVFSALSPMCEGLSREPGMPYSVKDQPTLTFVARQQGEAWTKPFVAVFEPSSVKEPSNIESVSFFDAKTKSPDFAGIYVKNKSGRTDYVFTNGSAGVDAAFEDMRSDGTYSIIGKDATPVLLFLGNGKHLQAGNVSISADEMGSFILEKRGDAWFYRSNKSSIIRMGSATFKLPVSDQLKPIEQ
jgi:hypothetical protein